MTESSAIRNVLEVDIDTDSCTVPMLAENMVARLEQMTTLYENEGLVANRLVRELEKANTRLAECERERDEAIYRASVGMRTKYEALLTENRLLLKALGLAIVWCRYRGNDGYDTCEDNCTKAYRYQEGCPVYLPTVQTPREDLLEKC